MARDSRQETRETTVQRGRQAARVGGGAGQSVPGSVSGTSGKQRRSAGCTRLGPRRVQRMFIHVEQGLHIVTAAQEGWEVLAGKCGQRQVLQHVVKREQYPRVAPSACRLACPHL